jgi:hypothetical protein
VTKLFDRRSTLVFVLAVLALVVAMSSTAAYAAVVAKNSVLSRSIKNGEVKTPDLANSGVTSAKIRDGQVAAADLANGAVGSAKLANGSVTSAKIADGTITGADLGEAAVGAQNLTLTETYFNTSASTGDADGTTNGGSFGTVEVSAACPAGWMPVSGGAQWVNPSAGSVTDKNLYLHSSYATSTGWYARGIVDIGAQGTVQLRVRAVCLAPWPQPTS